MLSCPQPGSLASTEARYQAYRRRFDVERKGKTVKLTFRQAPQPRFRSVTYKSPPSHHVYQVYQLRAVSLESPIASWSLVDVSKLVLYLRNGAVEELKTALPDRGRRSSASSLGASLMVPTTGRRRSA